MITSLLRDYLPLQVRFIAAETALAAAVGGTTITTAAAAAAAAIKDFLSVATMMGMTMRHGGDTS